MQKSRKKISRLNKQDQKQKEGSRRWYSENWGLGPLQAASSAGPKWTYHFSASSVSPSQPPQTGFRERISCPPSPAASAGRGPKVCRLESGSSSSTSFPRSLHETETWSAAADQHSRREEDSKAHLVSSPWPCPLQATPSEMARLLPPPRGVTYAGEAGPPGRKNNSPRGRAYLAEGGGAQGTGGRGAAVPPTGPWRSSHTPHPGEVRQSVRDLQAAPPQSFGGGGPTLLPPRSKLHPPARRLRRWRALSVPPQRSWAGGGRKGEQGNWIAGGPWDRCLNRPERSVLASTTATGCSAWGGGLEGGWAAGPKKKKKKWLWSPAS